MSLNRPCNFRLNYQLDSRSLSVKLARFGEIDNVTAIQIGSTGTVSSAYTDFG